MAPTEPPLSIQSPSIQSPSIQSPSIQSPSIQSPSIQSPSIESRFRAMNTDVHVIVVGGGPALLEAAEAMVRDREARWSRFLDDSELSVLNHHAGSPVAVSPDTFSLIADAIDAYHLTGGAFDPTVLQCLVDAGYDRSFELVDGGNRSAVRPAPGPVGIELDRVPLAVRLPPGVGLDLGGLGKGATADAVTEELMTTGADGCCVNVGGDLRVRGVGPAEGAWTVDLACPGAVDHRRIALAQGAVCTSTVGRRSWTSAAGRQHHLRNPATGLPFDGELFSVSVIAARATQADILTKAAFAAGFEAAAASILRHGATGLLVSTDGTVEELPGFQRFAAPGAGTG